MSEKKVSEKTYKEHHRLYYHEGHWITTAADHATSSRESSPFSDVVHFDNEGDLQSSSCGSVNSDPENPCYSVISEVDFNPACIDEAVSEASKYNRTF